MNIAAFIAKWTGLFANTPAKNITAQKMREFTTDTGSLLPDNIKTVNGNSLIGSGNVVIGGVTLPIGIPDVSNLQPSLNNKQDILVSGTNIKTIEGQSLLGSGNIDLSKSDVGLSNVDNTSDLNKPISTLTQTALNTKQNTLVSGTNIKTINSNTLLGVGNIVVDSLVENTGNTVFDMKTKRIGYVNGVNVFTGIEINTFCDGQYYTYIYVYDNGVLIANYGTDEGGNLSLTTNPSVGNPKLSFILNDNDIPTKSNLGDNLVEALSLTLPQNQYSKLKRYRLRDAAIPNTGNINLSYDYSYLSAPAYAHGDVFEFFFRAKTIGTVNFTTFNYYTAAFAIETGKYYKFNVYMNFIYDGQTDAPFCMGRLEELLVGGTN